MWQSVEILNVFNTLTLKQIFWKTKKKFKKLEFYFLVQTTKIGNALFPFKAAISEANFKTNRMVSISGTYQNERNFANNYFVFLKILFYFKNLLYRVDLMYQRPKCPYSFFFHLTAFFFPVSTIKLISLTFWTKLA